MKNLKEKTKHTLKNPIWGLKQLKEKIIYLFLMELLYSKIREYNFDYKNLNIKFSTKNKYSKKRIFLFNKGKLHESPVKKILIDSLKQKDVFVDIGAHLGGYTCLVGKALKKGKVYSFEIDKKVFDLLKENIKLNNLKNVNAYNIGVSDKKGFVKIPKKKDIDPGLAIDTKLKKNKKYLTIKSTKLDSFFKNKQQKPTIIKIDVEGAEFLVLKGMKKLLEKENLKIFLEIHGNKLEKFNTNSKEIISFLQKKGYEIYHSCPK